ncbi:hypothetical protein JOC94_004389 [Bacillus thermophilus]|uniref:KTSC domain-containing protein n=1 Tax=Siminovitchia thermophila TaxID=1245522 RepID=A0ABS2RFK2_9BACI|nr:hypothetical protein [Siminovitchia thermophila]
MSHEHKHGYKGLSISFSKGTSIRFLGIDPKSFDKYIRPHEELDRFMIGKRER